MKQKQAFCESHDTESAEGGGAFLSHIRTSIAATIVLTIIVSGIYPLIVWGVAQVIFPNKANGSLVKRDGTPTTRDEEAVGSSLLGQNFAAAGYFHPRPSAAGNGYDATSSGGSNLGPLSAKLIRGTIKATTMPATKPSDPPVSGPDVVDYDGISDRIVHYCLDNNIPFDSSIALDSFKDKDGNVDDVKLIKSFNDDKMPLTITPKILIPGDAVTGSGSGLDPHISPRNAELQMERVAKARGVSVDKIHELIDEHTDRPDLGIFGDAGVNVLMLNIALDVKYPLPASQSIR
ncbi:MAG TPA: potassium-transporting ATPase subunit C [Tepidisphaeraceae bacterium]|jgi:K+-transporting ATPase ATPase C chain|nr:potassium-transporting ATPase subunit C [Tepidisphaeraceae bacterium]